MKRIGLYFILSISLFATNIPITVVGSNQTQIVINYTVIADAPCTITVTDNNNGPSTINDTNGSLFTGANIDTSRTNANGYLWPIQINGLNRTLVLGGHDLVQIGLDNKPHSRALQVNTDHTTALSCNGGADSGMVHASTQNIPFGSYYPELMIPQSNYWNTTGMSPWPQPYGDIDYTVKSGRTSIVVDPISGVLIQPVSTPQDNTSDTEGGSDSGYRPIFIGSTTAMDPNGVWTTPANGYATSDTPVAFASTSTVGDYLFLPFDYNPTAFGTTYYDAKLKLFGSSAGGTETADICFSAGNYTCASTPITITLSTISGCQTYLTSTVPCEGIPNTRQGSAVNFPSNYFAGWNFLNYSKGELDLFNSTGGKITGVAVSGSTLTISTPSGGPQFNPSRPAGSPIWLSGCSVGGPTALLHIATTVNTSTITVQESGQNLSGCTYQELAGGILIKLTSPGTIHVAARVYFNVALSASANSNGDRWICARGKVTDITTGCDGETYTTPQTGTLCVLDGVNAVYLMQDNTQRTCLQSNGWGNTTTHVATDGHLIFPNSPWLDVNKLFAKGQNAPCSGSPCLYTLTHIPNNYQEITTSASHSEVADNFTYTYIGSPNVESLIQADSTADPNVKAAVNSGIWPKFGYDTAFDTPNGGNSVQWRATTGGDESLCMLAWTDAATGNLIGSAAGWGKNGLATSACHFSPLCAGGYCSAIVTSGPHKYTTTVPLGGPFITRGVSIHNPDGTFHTWQLPSITTISNTNPAVITFSTYTDLDWFPQENASQGVYITCSGGTSAWTAANRVFYGHGPTSQSTLNTNVTLYTNALSTTGFDTTSLGAYAGQTITCTANPPIYSFNTSSDSNVAGALRLAINNTGVDFKQDYPSGNLPVRDGDPVIIPGFSISRQFFLRKSCGGCAANQVDVYDDVVLTTPTSFTASNGTTTIGTYCGGGNSCWLGFAETCPDPGSVNGSWRMGDSGIGTVGHPNARCVTVKTIGEFGSNYPFAGEATAYPYPSDATRSMLHASNLGDGIYDASHKFAQDRNDHEMLAIVKKVVNGDGTIDLTLERWFGDIFGEGQSNGMPQWPSPPLVTVQGDAFANKHAAGWTMMQEATQWRYVFDSTQPNPQAVLSINGQGHNDIGPSLTAGNITIPTYYLNGDNNNPVWNQTPTTAFGTPPIAGHKDFPIFQQNNTNPYTGLTQAYPSQRQYTGVAPTNEFNWAGDWAAMNPDAGTGYNSAFGTFNRGALIKIRGGLYDPGSTTNYVYLIGVAGTPSPKLFPLLVVNGVHGYFKDISGPQTVATPIGDSNIGGYCYVYKNGDCRPNSVVGQVFMTTTGFWEPNVCVSNNDSVAVPCAVVMYPLGGWAFQIRQNPITYDHKGIRRLTLGFHAPMEHYDFANWITSPDAQWGLFALAPVGARVPFQDTNSMQWWRMKLPPFPSTDSVNRANFGGYWLNLSGTSGDLVRVTWGYSENGGATFNSNTPPVMVTVPYCTSRMEGCWTSNGAMISNPFQYASETQTKTPCGSTGCRVQVPAIPGRLFYYQVERTNAAGAVSLGEVHLAVN